MKFAICNETFQGMDWETTCRSIAELGYDAVEIAPFTLAKDIRALDAAARQALARTAHQAGLDVVGLHWLLVSPHGLSLTDRDAEVRARTADYLAALVDFCSDLGGRILVLGSPSQRRIPEGDTRDTAAERLELSLQPALRRAEKLGVRLCLEPLPPPEADFILTLEEAVALVQRFRHPALCTIFDVKSASSEGRPLPDLIRRYAPYLAHVHANDANRRGPGSGETDFVPILAALRQINYAGFVSIEVFDYKPDPITIGREGLRYLRESAEKQESVA